MCRQQNLLSWKDFRSVIGLSLEHSLELDADLLLPTCLEWVQLLPRGRRHQHGDDAQDNLASASDPTMNCCSFRGMKLGRPAGMWFSWDFYALAAGAAVTRLRANRSVVDLCAFTSYYKEGLSFCSFPFKS